MKALKLQFSSVSTEASGFESMFSIPSSTINLLKVGSSRGLCITGLFEIAIALVLSQNMAPASKLKSMKIKDDPPLAIYERTGHRTCDHAEYISTKNMSHHLKSLGRSSSRSKIPRPSKYFFPPCMHCGCIDHLSNECLYYPVYGLCGSYDHDTNGYNMIISLERKINPRNPQHDFKRCEACGSSNHTTTDHYDIEWFKRGEALQAKNVEALKSTRAEPLNANRSKTPTRKWVSKQN
ncbi:hypothetical protein Tco_1002505 [Tanacetum coccineum]|uniref:Zinc knuckle CX2CX4HX4C domain-containing protein n=1 Tax=Tanacetum coccineum TaxID=301880 RepID=A0ABQ5F8Q9_9ASTR